MFFGSLLAANLGSHPSRNKAKIVRGAGAQISIDREVPLLLLILIVIVILACI
jgi:hypothetical protein